VNLIAQGRQWFKAEAGLGVRETPLEVSICAGVLLQPGVTVVPDLARDPRFRGNPLVTGNPPLRFYAGTLLETPEGLPLGTLCFLDREPRPAGLTPEQAFTLEALARQVMSQLELRRALQRQRASEAHQRLMLESATEYAICTLDLAVRFTTWNEGARRILGYEEGEALGRDGGIIFTPEDREAGAPEAEMRMARDQGRAENERWHLRQDGARFWASGLLMPMHEVSGGPPIGYLKILRDRIPEQRAEEALRESEERYRALVETSPDAIYAHQDGHLVFANARAAKLFGAGSPDGLVGQAALDLGLGKLDAGTDPYGRAVHAGLAELTFRRLDGTTFPVEADGAAVQIGRRAAVQVVFRDVTERRRAEAHQRLLLRELSHCVKNTLAMVQGVAAWSLVGDSRLRSCANSSPLGCVRSSTPTACSPRASGGGLSCGSWSKPSSGPTAAKWPSPAGTSSSALAQR
jgi:PAS domain S-box-containing protein